MVSAVYLKHFTWLFYYIGCCPRCYFSLKSKQGIWDWNDERSSFYFAKQVIATVVGIQVKNVFRTHKAKAKQLVLKLNKN